MDIQIRKQLEQLEYIKDKLEYIEYDEALGCYIEKQDGLPTGVAAWVNGAFYGFEQAALKPSPFPAVISAGVIEIERRQGIVTLIMMRPASNILRLPSSNNLKPPPSNNPKCL